LASFIFLQVPADGILITGHSLAIDESSMTGESKIVSLGFIFQLADIALLYSLYSSLIAFFSGPKEFQGTVSNVWLQSCRW
jgi:magnesium-transporting ATPase (P-type)